MPGLIVAAVTPDNTPHGYNWTFAFPMLLFIVIALVLYALFSRPHRRVPGRPIQATPAGSRVPDPATARAAAVAGGLSTAAGGGTTELFPDQGGGQAAETEPGGAHLTGSVSPDDESASEPPEGGGDSEGSGASE